MLGMLGGNYLNTSFKPVQPNGKLHRVHARVGGCQACVGDVFVAGVYGEGPPLVGEKMKPKGGVCEEISGRSKGRDFVVGEQHAASQFQVGNGAVRGGEVPLSI